MTKYFLKISVVLFGLLLGLASCQDNSIEPIQTSQRSSLSALKQGASSAGGGGQEGENGEEKLCFEITYPVTLVLPNGDQKDINSDDELFGAVDEYYNANPDSEEDPTLKYPIQISKDGQPQTVSSDDELEKLVDECYGDDYGDYEEYGEGDCGDAGYDDHMDCYELVYPVTVKVGDLTKVVNNENEFDALWEQVSQDSMLEEFPEIQYPYDVKFTDGTTQTIDSDEALDAAFEKCGGVDDYTEEECYELVYPVTVKYGDMTRVINSENDLDELWSQISEDTTSEDYPEIQYPYDVKFTDGTTQTIDSDEALHSVYEKCGEGEEYAECFSLKYPLQVKAANGDVVTVNNDEEFAEQFFSESEGEPELVFPVTVTYEDGSEKTANSEEELDALYDACDNSFE